MAGALAAVTKGAAGGAAGVTDEGAAGIEWEWWRGQGAAVLPLAWLWRGWRRTRGSEAGGGA
ncbi:MAG: hypothetical protein ACO3B3_03635, partial [Cyanobium sp.]